MALLKPLKLTPTPARVRAVSGVGQVRRVNPAPVAAAATAIQRRWKRQRKLQPATAGPGRPTFVPPTWPKVVT